MHFACRVLLVPGKMIAELYSLLGCCVFLRQIHMHFAFRVLPVPVFTFPFYGVAFSYTVLICTFSV